MFVAETVLLLLVISPTVYAPANCTIIGSVNGLSHIRRQPIVGTNGGVSTFRRKEYIFKEIVFEIQKFSFKKMSSASVYGMNSIETSLVHEYNEISVVIKILWWIQSYNLCSWKRFMEYRKHRKYDT